MKFKVGDKVRIRPDLKAGYGKKAKPGYSDGDRRYVSVFMVAQYAGRIATVTRVSRNPAGKKKYTLDVDHAKYSWWPYTLEPAED